LDVVWVCYCWGNIEFVDGEKMRKIEGLIGIKENDPRREIKFKLVDGLNRLADLIESIDRDIENRILIVISILISVSLGFLVSNNMLNWAIPLFLILVVLLIFNITKEKEKKRKYRAQSRRILKDAKKIGLMFQKN
jgi:hypothetical protein